MSFSLPKDMLMGVSTASMQVEGGALDTNWNDWYSRGFIKDGTDPAAANDHWIRWREDTELMAQMGIETYRFSVEWARLMPLENFVDRQAVERYRSELQLLLDKGIRPLLTIHHFSNPMWFESKDGFEKRENLHYYLELAELVVKEFGDLCSDYITINEPNVYAANSFFFGSWPPGKKSARSAVAVMENLAFCHIKAYELIHRLRREMGYTDTMVGCANHMRVFEPKNRGNVWHRICTKLLTHLFQDALTDAMTLGAFRFPLRNFAKLPKGEYTDFIGLNYYSRSTISGIGDGVRDNCPKNDLGWEIYPDGLIKCAQRLYDLLPRPIWVTENGTCDKDDRFRSLYLYDHLKAIAASDLPFKRYYHWCFCDNFEWVEGNSAKFGLVSVDPATGERSIKESGAFYAAVGANKGVDENLFQRYIAAKEYDIR